MESTRLEEAARAGWLYYIAGNTQDEIARKLGVSRQSAQRLVSLAISERLIKVRLDYPISECMELGAKLKDSFALRACEIVLSDPDAPFSLVGVAEATANEMEKYLSIKEPQILALGTGRTLRASVEQLSQMKCPQHSIVSLPGNLMLDGSATSYNAVVRMADRVQAKHFPMPLPLFAATTKERNILHGLQPVRSIFELANIADVTFVGIGQMGEEAALVIDGFVSKSEMIALQKNRAVGEIVGWVFNEDGELIDGMTNDRVTSIPPVIDHDKPVFGIAIGEAKVPAIIAALRGKLINSLITNEATAKLLLQSIE